MRQTILNDLTKAMKEQNKDVLSVLRMVKGAIQLEEINVKHELSDDEVVAIIAKQIKTRKESIVEFEKGNRQDLVDNTNKEIEILNNYMPEQMSKEDIEKIIDDAFNKINPTGPSDMGKIMGMVTPMLRGKADMSEVSKMIKERLAK